MHLFNNSISGLRINDYLDDDPWAASLLECDSSTNGDLLRQLEAGCRLDPSAYRMERRQRRRNWETLVSLKGEPQVRSIGLSRANSETDSIATTTTLIDDQTKTGEMEFGNIKGQNRPSLSKV
ncbi:unnamed protein product [Protopolystoma xenopodis]|uniref:Uncharacterized protein n=1 Tax=Protopolystoma xenopodis TaxID=117903 RepID=A0A3S5FDU9_9PLAT|nr:unnamed protein product [Protopolystoma xenopodis]